MSEASIKALLDSLCLLQQTHEFSDLTIHCREKEFYVHKAIVCTRSRELAARCARKKKSTARQEITLDDDDEPRLVKLMINYLYRLDYDAASVWEGTGEGTAVNDAGDAEPDSPVGQKVAFFDGLGNATGTAQEAVGEIVDEVAPEEPATDPFQERPTAKDPASPSSDLGWYFPPSKKKDKKNKRKKTGFLSFDDDPSPAPPVDDEERRWTPPEIPSAEPEPEPPTNRPIIDLDTTDLSTHAHMHALARKYRIDDLEALARARFAEVAARDWQQTDVFAHAARFVCEQKTQSNGGDGNDGSLGDDDGAGLRDVVADTVVQHLELLGHGEMQDLFDSGNGLAWSVLRSIAVVPSI